jgi:hypothetical protein
VEERHFPGSYGLVAISRWPFASSSFFHFDRIPSTGRRHDTFCAVGKRTQRRCKCWTSACRRLLTAETPLETAGPQNSQLPLRLSPPPPLPLFPLLPTNHQKNRQSTNSSHSFFFICLTKPPPTIDNQPRCRLIATDNCRSIPPLLFFLADGFCVLLDCRPPHRIKPRLSTTPDVLEARRSPQTNVPVRFIPGRYHRQSVNSRLC